jgi:Icc-related predicted phosphoesterase
VQSPRACAAERSRIQRSEKGAATSSRRAASTEALENLDALRVLLACEASPPAADDLGERDDLSQPTPTATQRRRGVGNRSNATRVATTARSRLRKRHVRLVCFGDITWPSTASSASARHASRGRLRDPVGDLTNFADPPDAFRVVDAVRAHCPNVLAVTGNLDILRSSTRSGPKASRSTARAAASGRSASSGCGGSNVTPMDTPTELEEDDIRADPRARSRAVADAPCGSWSATHPPFDTRLDRLDL